MSLSYFSGTVGGAGLLQQGEALQGALRGPRDGRDDREVLLLLLQPVQHQHSHHGSESLKLSYCNK